MNNKKLTRKEPVTPLTLVETPFSSNQLLHILQRTPQQYIKTKPGKGGGTQRYVPGWYVKNCLNYAFGWLWDFTILSQEEKHGQVVVLGRLTIKNEKGEEILHKDQFGRADIKTYKTTKLPVDYGNDCKAAASDALKKCASELGIARDVYSNQPVKDIPTVEQKVEVKTTSEKTNVVLPEDEPTSIVDTLIPEDE